VLLGKVVRERDIVDNVVYVMVKKKKSKKCLKSISYLLRNE
jgi:hypothetical protein